MIPIYELCLAAAIGAFAGVLATCIVAHNPLSDDTYEKGDLNG